MYTYNYNKRCKYEYISIKKYIIIAAYYEI